LRRDKKRDIDYAVKDAQILVNHLRAMEVFNRGVKSRGFHCLPWVELLSPMND
jgi:hypothetical protein